MKDNGNIVKCGNEDCECELGIDYEVDDLKPLVFCPFKEPGVLFCPECYQEKNIFEFEEGIFPNDGNENINAQALLNSA